MELIILIVALNILIFVAYKVNKSKKEGGIEQVCLNCCSISVPRNKVKGSLMVEIILWLAFLIPGLIYSCWRLSSKYKACPNCGSENIVPLNSPKGQKLQEEYKINQ